MQTKYRTTVNVELDLDTGEYEAISSAQKSDYGVSFRLRMLGRALTLEEVKLIHNTVVLADKNGVFTIDRLMEGEYGVEKAQEIQDAVPGLIEDLRHVLDNWDRGYRTPEERDESYTPY